MYQAEHVFYPKATVTLQKVQKVPEYQHHDGGSLAGVVSGEFVLADRWQLCCSKNKLMSKVSWSERARNCLASQLGGVWGQAALGYSEGSPRVARLGA